MAKGRTRGTGMSADALRGGGLRKEIAPLVEALLDAGWKARWTGKNHLLLLGPTPADNLTIAGTGSGSSIHLTVKKLRKALERTAAAGGAA